jgi:hypothetical protein
LQLQQHQHQLGMLPGTAAAATAPPSAGHAAWHRLLMQSGQQMGMQPPR